MVLANSCLPAGTQVLYLDAGIEVVGDLGAIWSHVDSFFICKMQEHKMRTWCHPTFCSIMSVTEAELDAPQVSANIVGFVVGNEKATGVLSQVLGLACNPAIIVGHKWHAYSAVCKGHRHDQSILSLVCLRSGIYQYALDDFAGWQSRDATIAAGASLYVHRGTAAASASGPSGSTGPSGSAARPDGPAVTDSLKGITDSFVVNLAHRKDRLEQFFQNQPYIKCKRLEAVNGRTLTLTKDLCRLFMNNDFKWKKSVMGCALSHFGLWKHIAESSSSSYLILEDDAVLCADFVGKWNSIVGLVPADSDIIFLGGVLPPNKPALPMVTEPVNAAFARVAVNNVFGSKRRYFHFCTYSYIITTAGAQKLCRLIQERGLYTSADHMLVNNMDLLNVYFTTPLLAGCVQDSDPVYQKADFNNFTRVDKFDSEIWNNTDAFTQMEVDATMRLEPLTVIYFEEGQQKQCIDSEWLREIFQREFVWTCASASTSTSTGVGTTVLLYYQHTTPVSVIEGWMNRNMDRVIYILHASDETCTADVSIYKHPAVKCVFRNYWRSDVVSECNKVVTLPLGYLNGKGLSGSLVAASMRTYDWSFAGATDRPGRLEALTSIKQWSTLTKHKLHLTPTWGSAANLEPVAYTAILQQSRFVPCLDGFYNTESYRFYEALEAGCVPVICVDEKATYSHLLNGAPLVTVNSWSSPVLVSDWDGKQKEVFSWWQSFKRSLSVLVQSKFA